MMISKVKQHGTMEYKELELRAWRCFNKICCAINFELFFAALGLSTDINMIVKFMKLNFTVQLDGICL